MRLKKQITLYVLLCVFGLLSFKSLFLDYSENSRSNCADFGHIHNLKSTASMANNEIKTDQKQPIENEPDCHEGKMSTGIYLFPTLTFVSIDFSFPVAFLPIFKINPNFTSPAIELFRKPPRLV